MSDSIYTSEKIKEIIAGQREFFKTGKTLDVNFRIEALKKLKNAIESNVPVLEEALMLDLGRSRTEAYFSDIGSVISDINETLKHIKQWAKPETHFSGIKAFPSITTKVYKIPYGVTLIFSPYNYPVFLSFSPLIASLAAGNTAIVKVSSKTPNCSDVIAETLRKAFDERYVAIIKGNHDVANILLEERFDKIFYTGSPKTAGRILLSAAKNLTPVALELGGETGNWAIIRKDADIKDAARKIAFFKALNAGQICININQIAVAKEIADEFIEELKKAFISQLGQNASDNSEYPHLINKAAFDKAKTIIGNYSGKLVFGGEANKKDLKISPAVLYPVDVSDDIVQSELFSPILPVIPYKDAEINSIIKVIESREHPLALYIFTKDIKWAKATLSSMQFGGGCINEVCMQMMAGGVPFNGCGHSGMGAYHGEWGFREFSHPSTVLIGKNHLNLSLREQPYSEKKYKIIKLLEK